jgi:hypothetical protein
LMTLIYVKTGENAAKFAFGRLSLHGVWRWSEDALEMVVSRLIRPFIRRRNKIPPQVPVFFAAPALAQESSGRAVALATTA